MDEIILNSIFAELSPVNTHPGLAVAKITYIDDQPNANGWGIAYEDFEDLRNTLINTPIKMRFAKADVKGHMGSIPVGHITGFTEDEENGIHKLNIDAVLYADDYPTEVTYLREKFAKGEAPGVSCEITYKNSIVKDGVKWIKGLVARAATFVKDPAYGSRTALLALASNDELSPEEFMTELVALANKENGTIDTDKGGNKMTDEEIRKLQDELATAKTALSTAQTDLAAKDEEIKTLAESNKTLTASVEEKDTKIAEYQTKEVLATRQTALADAGISLEIKPERLVKMAEEDFTDYIEDLKKVSAEKKKDKLALASTTKLPRFSVTDNDGALGILTEKLRTISRSNMSAETE